EETIMGPIVLGIIWNNIILGLGIPIVLAAKINSRDFNDKNSPRTNLEVPVQLKAAKINMSVDSPGSKIVTNVINKNICGNEIITSTILINIESIIPPKYPAIDPTIIPIVFIPITAKNPIVRDTLAP